MFTVTMKSGKIYTNVFLIGSTPKKRPGWYQLLAGRVNKHKRIYVKEKNIDSIDSVVVMELIIHESN